MVPSSIKVEVLITVSGDREVQMWNMETRTWTTVLKKWRYYSLGHRINRAVFSDDLKLLASRSIDGSIRIWTVSTGAGVMTGGHPPNTNLIPFLTFTRDSRFLISVSSQGHANIWDAPSGASLATVVFGTAITEISVDKTDTCLETDIGNFALKQPLSQLAGPSTPSSTAAAQLLVERCGLGFSEDRTWLMWDSHKLLWLPQDCRPRLLAVLESGSTAVIMHPWGKLFSLNIDMRGGLCV